MKTLKKILTITFLGILLTSFGQDASRMDKITDIANKSIAKLDGPKFGVDDQETKKNLSLYGEYFKQKAYADALPYWRYVFFNAPKYSKNTYIRGAKLYKALIKESTGEAKEMYIDTLLAIYEVRVKAFPSGTSEKTKTLGWYSSRRKGNEANVFEMFNNTFTYYTEHKTVAPASFLTYWMDMAVKADKTAHAISSEKVLETYEIVANIIDEQLPGEKGGQYKGAQNKILENLNKFSYLNCDNIVPMTEKMYRANPDDENTIKKAYKALRSGSCTESPLFKEVATKMLKIQPSAALYKFLSSKAKKSGDLDLAIQYLNKAAELSNETEKVALLLRIGGMYYKKGSKSKAREYAKKVLAINPNSGKAYILIGRTYAGACGSGIEKQATYWVAVDTWNKAKSVDSSVSSEAQKLINTYSGSFPSKKDLFMLSLKAGDPYTSKCLGIKTRVRTSD